MSARKATAGDGPYPLPEGWRWAKLGEIATWGSGGTPKRSVPEYFGGSVPWLSISDLNDGNIYDSRECLTKAGIENSAAKIVPEGTIFVAMYGSIGKLGIASFPMATSQAIAWAIPDDGIVDRKYLFKFLLSQRSKLQSRGRGGTQSNIGQKDLKEWKIPLAPLSEQRRIADTLDSVDSIRERFSNACESLNSAIGANLTDFCLKVPMKEYLGTEIFQNVRNGVSPSSKGKNPGEVLTLSAVTGEGFRPEFRKAAMFDSVFSHEKTVHEGDLLICRGNGNIDLVGRGVLADRSMENVAFPDTVISATVDPGICRPEFLEVCWRIPAVRSQIESSCRTTNGTFKINQKAVYSVSISLPSVENQDIFCEYLGRIRSMHSAAMYRGKLGNDLYESLQSRAFRGEL